MYHKPCCSGHKKQEMCDSECVSDVQRGQWKRVTTVDSGRGQQQTPRYPLTLCRFRVRSVVTCWEKELAAQHLMEKGAIELQQFFLKRRRDGVYRKEPPAHLSPLKQLLGIDPPSLLLYNCLIQNLNNIAIYLMVLFTHVHSV